MYFYCDVLVWENKLNYLKKLLVDLEPITTIAENIMGQALTDSKEQDFKYLGSWTEQDRDIQTRKALAF